MWQKNIPFSEWDKTPYWEFEEIIKLMNERNKEESEKQKKQQEEQNKRIPNMNDYKPSNFKPPSLPKI